MYGRLAPRLLARFDIITNKESMGASGDRLRVTVSSYRIASLWSCQTFVFRHLFPWKVRWKLWKREQKLSNILSLGIWIKSQIHINY